MATFSSFVSGSFALQVALTKIKQLQQQLNETQKELHHMKQTLIDQTNQHQSQLQATRDASMNSMNLSELILERYHMSENSERHKLVESFLQLLEQTETNNDVVYVITNEQQLHLKHIADNIVQLLSTIVNTHTSSTSAPPVTDLSLIEQSHTSMDVEVNNNTSTHNKKDIDTDYMDNNDNSYNDDNNANNKENYDDQDFSYFHAEEGLHLPLSMCKRLNNVNFRQEIVVILAVVARHHERHILMVQ